MVLIVGLGAIYEAVARPDRKIAYGVCAKTVPAEVEPPDAVVP